MLDRHLDPPDHRDPYCETCGDTGELPDCEATGCKCSCHGEDEDPGPHLSSCLWADLDYAPGDPCPDCPTCNGCGGQLRKGDHRQCWRIE